MPGGAPTSTYSGAFLLAWTAGSAILAAQVWLWAWLQGSHGGWWACLVVTLPDAGMWAAAIPLVVGLAHRVPPAAATWRRGLIVHVSAAICLALGTSLLHGLMAAGLGWVSPGAELRALLALRLPLHLPTWVLLYVAIVLGATRIAPPWPGAADRRDVDSTDEPARVPGASRPQWLALPVDDGAALLSMEEVDWIEADRNYAVVHAAGRKQRIRESLGSLQARLPEQFVRIHRSRLVNLDRVVGVYRWRHGDFVVRLQDGTRLKLSRTYRREIEERLGTRL